MALADKYRDPATFDRTVTLAWTQAQVQLHHLGIDASEAHLFQDLAGRILYADPTLRPSADTLKRNASGAAGAVALRDLRRPPDRPGPDRRARGPGHRPPAPPRARVLAHEGAGGRPRHPQREGALLHGGSPDVAGGPGPDEPVGVAAASGTRAQGKVFILRKGSPLRGAERDALQAAARAILLSRQGTLAEQLARATLSRRDGRSASPPPGESGSPPPTRRRAAPGARVLQRPGRVRRRRAGVRDRPRGGAMDARALDQRRRESRASGSRSRSPAPDTRGRVNSRENQLTPWSNDPVSDPPGETHLCPRRGDR